MKLVIKDQLEVFGLKPQALPKEKDEPAEAPVRYQSYVDSLINNLHAVMNLANKEGLSMADTIRMQDAFSRMKKGADAGLDEVELKEEDASMFRKALENAKMDGAFYKVANLLYYLFGLRGLPE